MRLPCLLTQICYEFALSGRFSLLDAYVLVTAVCSLIIVDAQTTLRG